MSNSESLCACEVRGPGALQGAGGGGSRRAAAGQGERDTAALGRHQQPFGTGQVSSAATQVLVTIRQTAAASQPMLAKGAALKHSANYRELQGTKDLLLKFDKAKTVSYFLFLISL